MDIRIGIANTARELAFETSQTAADVEKAVEKALGEGTGFLKLNDDKGKVYLVPVQSLAYVEVGGDTARRVGFVA
ncbi:DUF3107 domain-containing protein [Homoserinibacter sp. GY 40078]|uniref:DUF3107 domain-containing protein n=1 Tax=Homoserinibacter sp. GY 40078 TaxID=2603275 RepID=UPI0011CC0A98|nr:DUF3107 domain-containing protein [Homoserinibacter sp. GY 40078]TXK19619.1 DUF3107 domain-containing protein [Homoserinibacter sp. GY 40078]